MNADYSEFSNRVTDLQSHYTAEWHTHSDPIPPSGDALTDLIVQQHRFNFDLWHEEDKAREPGAEDRIIAEVKRNIDSLNQQRNDAITQIDLALEASHFNHLPTTTKLPWNSETVGSIIDRLSIASLKVFHMHEQVKRSDASAEHIENCRHKVSQLRLQLDDLALALQQFVDDVLAGKKQNKLYHQFKMYNDPALNPKIYRANKDSD